jgi:hypothetical protein
MTHLWTLYEHCWLWTQMGAGVGHCAVFGWTLEGVSLPW